MYPLYYHPCHRSIYVWKQNNHHYHHHHHNCHEYADENVYYTICCKMDSFIVFIVKIGLQDLMGTTFV